MDVESIFFDLDGTLTDPKQGVVKSIQHALETLGRPSPLFDELLWCIGPPLLDSFKTLLGHKNGNFAQTALSLYRERYDRIGKFENKVYDGVFEVLEALQEMGIKLYVATSKPRVFAEQICDHFELSQYFCKIYGPPLTNKQPDKGELIAQMLVEEKLQAAHTIMVGDRKFDMAAAQHHNIKTIGALYGYGSEKELLASGADYVVQRPSDIPTVIQRIKEVDYDPGRLATGSTIANPS